MSEGSFFNISYFFMGLLGGFGHCLGMCGPVVLAWTAGMRPSTAGLLLYNLGRVFSYVFAGMVVALAGSIVVFGRLYWLQKWIMGGVGFLMVLGGVGLLVQIRLGWFVQSLPSGLIKTFMQRGPFPLGLVNGFFPCGLVYMALAGVAGSSVSHGHPAIAVLQGGLLMLLFGTGTSVAMFGLGVFTRTVQGHWRVYLYRLSGALMAGVGGLLLWRALRT